MLDVLLDVLEWTYAWARRISPHAVTTRDVNPMIPIAMMNVR